MSAGRFSRTGYDGSSSEDEAKAQGRSKFNDLTITVCPRCFVRMQCSNVLTGYMVALDDMSRAVVCMADSSTTHSPFS